MRMEQRPSGTGVILLSLFVAAILEVIPMPGALDQLRPEWIVLVTIYWVLALPHRIGVFWALGAGLFLDILTGSVLGQHGLALAVAGYITLLAYKRMRVFPAVQQSAVVFLLVGTASLISFIVQDASGRATQAPLVALLPAVVSALIWRPVFNVLRWTRRRLLVR